MSSTWLFLFENAISTALFSIQSFKNRLVRFNIKTHKKQAAQR
jgi:hypothetical protein